MVHEVETMAYANEVPWHGLGVSVSNDLTPAQMLEKAGLDWEVEKIPLYGDVYGARYESSHELLVRKTDGKVLDEVTKIWQPCQNHEAFEIFNDFVGQGDMTMETAGSLKGGQIVWALAKVKDSFTLFGGDKIDSYLLFSNPHQFGKIINIRFTPIRVVCWNTISESLRTDSVNQVRLTHRRKFDKDSVMMMLGCSREHLETYKAWGSFIGTKQVTQNLLENYFKEVFPVVSIDNKTEKEISLSARKCLELYETQPGSEFAPGSFWQAWNAVTYFLDHKAGRNQDNRLASAWFGEARKTKMRAAEIAVQMANAI